jgi:hypothetical protein
LQEGRLSQVNRFGAFLVTIFLLGIAGDVILAFIPTMLVAMASPAGLTGDIIVKGSVYLSYLPSAVMWSPGTYANCLISHSFTDCANLSTSTTTGPNQILLFSVAMIILLIIMLLIIRVAIRFLRNE